jgi:hypothetical protein
VSTFHEVESLYRRGKPSVKVQYASQRWMTSLSLTEPLIGPDFYQVDVLAWVGYLLELSSVFKHCFCSVD